MAADSLPKPLEGRNLHTQQVSFLRKNISSKDPDLTVRLGVLPRGAVILSVKCFVRELFPEAKLKIGSTHGGNEFSEKDIKTKGVQDFTPTDSKLFVSKDDELVLYAKRDKTTTAGECSVVVTFITNR